LGDGLVCRTNGGKVKHERFGDTVRVGGRTLLRQKGTAGVCVGVVRKPRNLSS